jgi:hypothetical protein
MLPKELHAAFQVTTLQQEKRPAAQLKKGTFLQVFDREVNEALQRRV